MKILSVKSLAIKEVKVLEFGAFPDNRGYFTETFRQAQIATLEGFSAFRAGVCQANQSWSKVGITRGLHFQWNPVMGKLVRTLTGHMVDMVVDIRKNSPTFGHGIMYSMPSNCHEWIWVPPGFAHGNYFTESTTIEYFCTGDYNPKCEAGLCPLSEDIDWSLADSELVYMFKRGDWILSEKDRNGFSLERWKSDERSEVFKVGAAS